MLHRYHRAVASTKAETLVVLFHFFFYLVTLFVIVAVAFVCLLENLENVHVVLHCLIKKDALCKLVCVSSYNPQPDRISMLDKRPAQHARQDKQSTIFSLCTGHCG